MSKLNANVHKYEKIFTILLYCTHFE